ncbi:hypothetical protein [Deinococcus soli (ex Cha et al. 2016)]|uniref:hypothetical protein n=1 Tax=Deinococcus soli (ex Cha et al. 2016) TaxID=1309411 RepID=UPI00166A194C|nr:hypothetical protein [Deinococcus soli (ex Cha et al. 2016)]GGB68989.1 hypothetical protein GCM10008019_26510 [Deinococcus soli (ex Cha et al. 2016)]
MNRWHPTAQQARILAVLGVTAPLSARQIAVATHKSRVLTRAVLYQLSRTAWLSTACPSGCQRHASRGRTTSAYTPGPRAQLHLRGQWLTRPGRHLIALSDLVDATFRDRKAFMLNHPAAPITVQVAA